MRAAEKLNVTTLRHSSARQWLMRIALAVFATVMLLLVWRPAFLHAQNPAPAKRPSAKAKPLTAKDSATTTHKVRAGETLWSIATRYYGDGHEWRAVARRNGIPLTLDPPLRVGTELIIASPRMVAAVAAVTSTLPAAADTTTPKVATTPAIEALPAAAKPTTTEALRVEGPLAAQTAGKANAATRPPAKLAPGANSQGAPMVAIAPDRAAQQDTAELSSRGALRPVAKAERLLTRSATRIGLVDEQELRAARAKRDVSTVFLLSSASSEPMAAISTVTLQHAPIKPRRGEYLAAPFATTSDRLARAGRVIRRNEGPQGSAQDVARMQLADEVEISAPTGVTLAVGTQLVAVRESGATSGGGAVVYPSGVLEVVRVESARKIIAVVRSESGVIEQGQMLLPLEGEAAAAELQKERLTESDLRSMVSWTEPTSAMPSLQSFVLLAAGQAQGVKAGDEFALVQKDAKGADELLAVVRVVRVGAQGSSAVVIRHAQPGVATGVVAKR
ncbi:MAG: LysM peptidoglycan-binding domain-containing protein, partial [Gemmatimonadaceae bacterium]|nr:LysM peptidoglycan-binding domain-containing protein [Gemmatimonadaceae bacterium]